MNPDSLTKVSKSNQLYSLPKGRKLFRVTHRTKVTSEQLVFSLLHHYHAKQHLFAVFTLPGLPGQVFIETDASQTLLDDDLSHLKFAKVKVEDISKTMNDIYIPFTSLGLRPGRVVILQRPDFCNEIGQIVDINLQNGTVLVKCWPHIDYANLRKHRVNSQQKLNAMMPRNYRPPRVPFERRASPEAHDSTITIYGSERSCVEWDKKKFIGSFQYIWMQTNEVTPKSNIQSALSSVDLSVLASSVTDFEAEHPGFVDEMLNTVPAGYETELEPIKLMKYTGKSVNHPARSQSRPSSSSDHIISPDPSSQDTISIPLEIIEISSIEDSMPPVQKSEVKRQPRTVKPVLAAASDSMSATQSQLTPETQWRGPGILAARFFDPNQMTPADIELRRCDGKTMEPTHIRIDPAIEMDQKSERLPYNKFEHTTKQLSSPPNIFDEPLKVPMIMVRQPVNAPVVNDSSSSDYFSDYYSNDYYSSHYSSDSSSSDHNDVIPTPVIPTEDSMEKRKSPRDVKKKIVMPKEMQSKISMMSAEARRGGSSDDSDNDLVPDLKPYRDEKQSRPPPKSPQTSPVRHVAPKPVLETFSQKMSVTDRLLNMSSLSESESFDFDSDSGRDSLRKYVEIEKRGTRETITISSDSDSD